jgi:hypothetical protein
VAKASLKWEEVGPSNVPGELAVTVRRSTVQKSYHPRQQTVPKEKLDSSMVVHGIEETMAAAPKGVMNELG